MRSLLALLFAVLIVGCGPGAVASQPPAATPSATAVTPSSTPAPSPTLIHVPTNTAPPDLAGKWGTRVSGDPTTLTLVGDGYEIRRGGNSASGHIAVTGDEIRFDGSSLCEGIGRYTWTIADDRLKFEAIEPDECPGRAEVMIGVVYGNKSEP